ncbi:MAG: hypothetical protein ACFNNL_08615 [Kingella oralis]
MKSSFYTFSGCLSQHGSLKIKKSAYSKYTKYGLSQFKTKTIKVKELKKYAAPTKSASILFRVPSK